MNELIKLVKEHLGKNFGKLQKVFLENLFSFVCLFRSEVFKARCKKTNDFVAMKLILMDQEKEGFPITALREIKILQELRHDNIVRLIEVCRSSSMLYDMKKIRS